MHSLFLLASSDDSSGAGSFLSFGILLLIPAAMYFLMIRPQRRRVREQQSLQKSLGVGDEIVTTSGIYGFITGEEGDKFWLEIDDDVQIRIARSAVVSKVDTSAADGGTKPAAVDGGSKSAPVDAGSKPAAADGGSKPAAADADNDTTSDKS
jgi:preprotein translocase subunit YajC